MPLKLYALYSHTWRCDQVATYVRPVEQPNRRGSQINRATSRGGRGQSHDQNQWQLRLLRSQIVGDRTQVLHSPTSVARPVAEFSGPLKSDGENLLIINNSIAHCPIAFTFDRLVRNCEINFRSNPRWWTGPKFSTIKSLYLSRGLFHFAEIHEFNHMTVDT